MAVVLDANMRLFADRMDISTSRMIQDYGLKSVDEIIEAEAAQGNTKAVDFARQMYNSPEKLMEVFRLADVENRFVILRNMDAATREEVLPLLEHNDLAMGLYFFTQDKLLSMLEDVDIEELVNVVAEAFPIEEIIMMYTEDDLAAFFQNDDLEKYDVINQLKCLPPEIMMKFVEGVTGMPFEDTNPMDLIQSIENMPDDEYKDFMSSIDPDVQRQLVYQITKEKPEYMQLFENETYINMLSTLMKQDMVKPMAALSQESLITMNLELPVDLMSIVAAQIDTKTFAEFLLEDNLDVLQNAIMM